MDPNHELIEASKYGDLETAANALSRGAEANAVIEGRTPLWWAAQEGHIEIVDLLLKTGANVNFSDPEGFTTLRQAMWIDPDDVEDTHLATFEHLLLHGADVNLRCATDGGCTVLHVAAAFGRLEFIRLLLHYGANPATLNDDGQTPYDTAIECGEMEAAHLLQRN
jgi:ankyrin repeat protein